MGDAIRVAYVAGNVPSEAFGIGRFQDDEVGLFVETKRLELLNGLVFGVVNDGLMREASAPFVRRGGLPQAEVR